MQVPTAKDLSAPVDRNDDDFVMEFADEAAPGAASDDAAASPATAAPPVFDAGKLDDLKAVMDQTKFTGLVGQFAAGLQARVERLQGLLETSNWPDAAREAHDIVSVAGNIGAARLSAMARDLEQSCRAGNETSCRSLTATFTTAAVEALRALKIYQAAA